MHTVRNPGEDRARERIHIGSIMKAGDSMLLFLAALAFSVLPEITIAFLFCSVQHSLSLWTTGAVRTVCALLGTVLLVVSARLFFRKRDFAPLKMNIGTVFSLLPSVLVYLLSLIVAEFIYPFLLTMLASAPVFTVVLQIALAVLLFLLQGAVFAVFLTGSMAGVKRPIRFLFRHFLTSLAASLLLGLFSQISGVAEYVFFLLPFTDSASARLALLLLSALLQTGMMWAAFCLIAKKAKPAAVRETAPENVQENIQENVPENTTDTIQDSTPENTPDSAPANIPGSTSDNLSDNAQTEKRAKEKPPLGVILQRSILAVLCAGACAFYLIATVSVDPIRTVTENLNDALTQYSVDIGLLRVDSAVKELESAEAEIALWKEAAGIDLTEIERQALKEQPDRSSAIRLHAMLSGNTGELESWLRVYGPDTQMALTLLDLYRGQELLSSAQEDSRKQAIIDCVSAGDYTTVSVSPEQIEARAVELQLALEPYEKVEEMYHLLSMLSRTRQAVESKRDLLPEALELAEKYPDDWIAQYIAADIGSSVTYDGANHYTQTSEAIMRYESLYRMEKAPAGEELYGLERSVAQMLCNVYDYKNALLYLNQVPEENKDRSVFMLEADCYERLEDYEGCYEFADRYLKSHPDEPYAMHYGALSAIKLENTESALMRMESLSDYIENAEEEDMTALDTSLYSLVQYAIVRDSTTYTQYKYAFYYDLTEEQLQEIAGHALLDHYLKAVYYNFGRGDDAAAALEEAEKVLEKRDDLPNAWYLEGSILYDLEEYEDAVTAYRTSLSIYRDNPTVWYALANAYYGMEDYELALEACDTTLSLVPVQDHGDNWYGVSVHCERLRHSVLSKLG